MPRSLPTSSAVATGEWRVFRSPSGRSRKRPEGLVDRPIDQLAMYQKWPIFLRTIDFLPPTGSTSVKVAT